MKKFLLFLSAAFMLHGMGQCSMALAAQTVISPNHFEGGKNLTKGHKSSKDAKDLAAVVIDLQNAANSQDSSLATKANSSDVTSALALKLDTAKLVKYTSAAVVSGDATPTVAVTGLGASDTILAVTQSVPGANSLPLLGWSNQLANSLDLIYSADPGDDAIVEVLVKKP